jgi:predicted acetyltransferase
MMDFLTLKESSMSKVILRDLTLADESQFRKALQLEWGDFDFIHYRDQYERAPFQEYLTHLDEMKKGLNLPEGHIPCSFLYAFNSEGVLVGRTSIRHELTDFLLKVGGHIGYGVLPTQRRKGYATSILKESLKYVRDNLPLVEKALVTCDENNEGSRKTIESNGGVWEDTIDPGDGTRKMRFWIQVKEE